MVREELVVALKNALERGQSIQEAIASLISAGFNPLEVREAAGEVNLDVVQKVSKPAEQISTTENQSQFKPLPKTQLAQSMQQEKPKKAKLWLIILLSVIFILLLGLVGLMIFGNALLKAITG